MSNIKSKQTKKNKAAKLIPLAERTGNLQIRLTNDYLFKVVFQNNEEILRPFLSALLDRDESELTEIYVTNTIVPGEAVDDKTIMLDIKICLNGKEIINLEMQVESVTEWKQRSIYYLCRAYSNLKEGENYRNVKPAHHIGILDFNLKDITPQFYSHFKLINIENLEIYSGDIELSVLNLKQIDKATEKNKSRKLDIWAKIFQAKTWEELKMLAKNNEFVNKVSDSIYAMTEDERIREQCFLRNERMAEDKYIRNQFAEKDAKITELSAQHDNDIKLISKQSVKLAKQSNKISKQAEQLTQKNAEIARLKAQLAKSQTNN